MIKRINKRLIGILLCLMLPQSAIPSQSTQPTVLISLQLRDPEGKPISGIGYLASAEDEKSFCQTNSDGEAHFELRQPHAVVRIGFDDGSAFAESEQSCEARRTKLKELLGQYYYPYFWEKAEQLVIHALANQSRYAIDLVLEPAVSVSGVIVSESGLPPQNKSLITARYSNGRTGTLDRNGQFVLSGLPKGRPNELFIDTFPRITLLPLGGRDLQQNLDLGKVLAGQVPADNVGTLLLRATDLGKATDLSDHPIGGGVTAISIKGDDMYSLFQLTNEGDMGVPGLGQSQGVKLPAGTYYLAPGLFHARDIQVALLDAVRQGVKLSGMDEFKVEIKSGEKTDLVYSEVKLVQALRSLAKSMGASGHGVTSTAPASSSPSPK